jgi:hypothetical protein
MTPARWTVLLNILGIACVLSAGSAMAEGPVDCVNPPQGQMDLEGPHIRVGDAVWAGPTAQVVVKWVDGKTGGPTTQAISQSREELDAYAARRGSLPSLKICGDTWNIQPLAFAVDAAAPDITWEVVDLDEFPNQRRGARNPKGLSWSGGASWKPLKQGAEPLRIRTDTPQLLLHGAQFDIGDQTVSPNNDQMLRVRFQDNGAGVDHLTFQLRPGTGGKMVLAIETVDLVGNSRKVEWSLTDEASR